ncbi:MAG: cytochrome c oxidase subunit 3, partial [Chloroflexi bacterium]|nr:cytochrome c oxidase subunit 3 [Chloroflexota bacterium]
MWLFLGSDCLFFGSLISAYLLYRDRSVVGPYPSELYDIPFTSVSSFVLLMSSFSMVLGLSALQRGNIRGMRIWLSCTAFLGVLFLGGQAFEFTEFYREGLTLHQNLFGTTFFVLTGFHGAHVSVGVLILLSIVASSFRGRVSSDD